MYCSVTNKFISTEELHGDHEQNYRVQSTERCRVQHCHTDYSRIMFASINSIASNSPRHLYWRSHYVVFYKDFNSISVSCTQRDYVIRT